MDLYNVDDGWPPDRHSQGYVKFEYRFAGRGTHNRIREPDRQHLAHPLSRVTWNLSEAILLDGFGSGDRKELDPGRTCWCESLIACQMLATVPRVLLITQIPYTVWVPRKGRNECILQPKPSNRTLSQLYWGPLSGRATRTCMGKLT